MSDLVRHHHVGDADVVESVRVLVPHGDGGAQAVQDTLPVLGEPSVSGDDQDMQAGENFSTARNLDLLPLPGLPGPVGGGERQQTLVDPELLPVVLALLHLPHQQLGEAGGEEVGGLVHQVAQPHTVQDEEVGHDRDSVCQTEQVVHGDAGPGADTDHGGLQSGDVPAVAVGW